MKYPKGHEFEIRDLRPSQIRVDELYQRQLDTKRVDRIAAQFNGDTFNEPKVSYRDGVYWVFDGQHSIAVWRKINNGEDKLLTCKVYKGMTWLEECEAFVRQNGLKKDPTTNEKLRAAFNGSNPDVADMVNISKLCGYVVDFNSGKTPTRIVCTGTLFRTYKALGSELFTDMLTAIHEAWYGDMDSISQQIISGMATFYKTYRGFFKRSDLVSSLKRHTPAEIIRNGRRMTNATNTYTHEIVRAYNNKRRYKLDENMI